MFDDGKLYPTFTDQQVSITFIDEACQALEKIITQKLNGVFHASSADLTTPYEIYKYLINKCRDKDFSPQTSSIDTMTNPVRYPKFGGLKVEETEKKLGIKFSTWKEVVDKLVAQGISV